MPKQNLYLSDTLQEIESKLYHAAKVVNRSTFHYTDEIKRRITKINDLVTLTMIQSEEYEVIQEGIMSPKYPSKDEA